MTADFFSFRTNFVHTEDFPDRERMNSANSKVFNKAEQKISPQESEQCGIKSALKTI